MYCQSCVISAGTNITNSVLSLDVAIHFVEAHSCPGHPEYRNVCGTQNDRHRSHNSQSLDFILCIEIQSNSSHRILSFIVMSVSTSPTFSVISTPSDFFFTLITPQKALHVFSSSALSDLCHVTCIAVVLQISTFLLQWLPFRISICKQTFTEILLIFSHFLRKQNMVIVS